MLKAQIKVGGLYLAKVSGVITTVRVDRIRETTAGYPVSRDVTVYDVTNTRTGRKTTFRSAAKFRCPARPAKVEGEQSRPPIQVVDSPAQSATATDAGTPAQVHDAYTLDEEGNEVPCQEEGEHRIPPTPSTPVPSAATIGATAPVQTSAPTKEGEQRSPFASPECHVQRDSGDSGSSSSNLAQRIAAINRSGREVGSPVAGMIPNAEQESILATASESGLKVLVVAAGAGTGKTATLKMLEQVLPGRGQYTAFNASLVNESKAKFSKCAVNTTHSLAFRAVGKQFAHRLNGERMRSYQIARILGIESQTIVLKGAGEPEHDADGKPTGRNLDKAKVLQADFLAGQVTVAIRKFCQSADREISEQHFRYLDGIESKEGDHHSRENNDRVRDYLLPFARKAWADLSRTDGQLPFSHDVYVKLWQLGEGTDRPIIASDYILLDEAQDTAPVFLDILKQQKHALLVLVGDDNQQIYEWRGAVNAMGAFPGSPRRLLSQSYRFGQAVADVANAVLRTLEQPTDLVMRGLPTIPSRVAPVDNPRCYLYRTNAGAVGRVMSAIASGKRPHLIGGGGDVVEWCQAAMDLQSKRGTRHPELCCFETWGEVEEYSKTDEGADMRLMVKLIEEFGAQEIRDALKDMPKEENADLVVSTAHKSKGREWDTVCLGPDFPTANKMNDADRRLLYVAATRAKLTLDVSKCPSFCGGYDNVGCFDCEETQWIPGLVITYTSPMPTQEEQDAWISAKATATEQPKVAEPAKDEPKREMQPNAKEVVRDGGFTWCKLADKWLIRGPKGVALGTRVSVSRKNGTTSNETIRSVVKEFGDAWIYGL